MRLEQFDDVVEIKPVGETEDLPVVDFPGPDLGHVIELIPPEVRKWLYGIVAILSFLGATTAGVISSLVASGLMVHQTGFTVLTILAIVGGVLTTLTSALGYADRAARLTQTPAEITPIEIGEEDEFLQEG